MAMERFSRTPPEKTFRSPKNWFEPRNGRRRSGSAPGTGIAATSRNTMRMAKTKRIFLRRSGSLNARRKRSNIGKKWTLRSAEWNGTARVVDAPRKGLGEADAPERVALRDCGVAHDLHGGNPPLHPTDNAFLDQRGRINGCPGWERGENPSDVHHCGLRSERMEAIPPEFRELLHDVADGGADLVAGAGPLAFRAATRRGAALAAAANALRAGRSGSGLEIMELHKILGRYCYAEAGSPAGGGVVWVGVSSGRAAAGDRTARPFVSSASASSVAMAFVNLFGVRETILPEQLVMPASSTTARTAPPAMMPDPTGRGRRMTRAAAYFARTSCAIEPSFVMGTRMIPFRARATSFSWAMLTS